MIAYRHRSDGEAFGCMVPGASAEPWKILARGTVALWKLSLGFSFPLNDVRCGMRAFHEALAGRFGAALARGWSAASDGSSAWTQRPASYLNWFVHLFGARQAEER